MWNGVETLDATRAFELEDVDYEGCDMIVLPGGMPGAANLGAHAGLTEQIRAFAKAVEGGQTGGFDLVYGEGCRVKRLTVGGVDISEYSIFMDCDKDACHTLAANDLRDYIGKACGYYPEISDIGAGHLIILEQVLPGEYP